MRNFRELNIWKDAIDLTIEIYDKVKSLPDTEKFSLTKQMKRCAVSIPSNIAEGCRGSNKEFTMFLNIAMGSSFELETQLEIAYKVGYIEQEIYIELIDSLNTLQRRINAFRNTIK